MRESEHGRARDCLVAVRWPLLESYALARQEGLSEPTGLVVDLSAEYGLRMSQVLFAGARLPSHGQRRVSCVERSLLTAQLRGPARDVAEALRAYSDDPGCFTAVVLAEVGTVIASTWQELMTASARPVARLLR